MAADKPAAPLPVQWVIWTTLVFSLVIYGLLPILIEPPTHRSPPPEGLSVGILALVGLSTFLGTVVARNALLVRPAQSRELDLSTPRGMARFFQASIIFWVFSESIGIYGLVLFFLFGETAYLYPFLLAAAGSMLYHRPDASKLQPPASAADLAREDIKIG